MALADFRRSARPAPAAAAAAALLIAPAIAFGAIGFGGMHGGGAHHGGAGHAPPPPAIDSSPRPPFFDAPPATHIHTGFHQHDDFRSRHDRFDDRRQTWALGGPWGWGGYWGDEGAYASGAGGPVYVQRDEAQAEAPAACPELITWQPKLGRATRQRLCDDIPDTRG